MRNIKNWNLIWAKGLYEKKYPDTQIQAFAKYHLPEKKRKKFKILDLGFGNGVHLNMLNKQGFKCYGIESSEFIINEYKKKYRNNVIIKKGCFTKIAFKKEFFNCVVCNAVLYYENKKNAKKGFEEIYRVLKPNGVARIYILSNLDYKYKKKLFESNDWTNKKIRVSFFSKSECERLTKKFAKTFFGLENFNFIDYTKMHSYWVLTCYK